MLAYAQNSGLELEDAADLEILDFDNSEMPSLEASSGSDLELPNLTNKELENTSDKLMEEESQSESYNANEIADAIKESNFVPEESMHASKDSLNYELKVVKSDKTNSKSFDVGAGERELLILAKEMSGKIPDNEWNELVIASSETSHEVQKGEWLWKISERYFGSGFYYSKIWSLNPYITNPHEIEKTTLCLSNPNNNGPPTSIIFGGGDVAQFVVCSDLNKRVKTRRYRAPIALPGWEKDSLFQIVGSLLPQNK
jgi:hypothetical protein